VRSIAIIAAAFLVAAAAAPAAAQTDTRDQFFLKANLGGNVPSMPNLSDELSLQGDESIGGGYSFAVALGRTIAEHAWAFELHFGVSFLPEFVYVNEYEDFEADLTHYSFALLAKKSILPRSEVFRPWVGAGAGWGVTNLISGSGKIQGVELLGLLQLEVVLRENLSLVVEGIYCAGLADDTFENPFLENIAGQDAVLRSDGEPLEDRYSAAAFRIGVLVWLPPPEEF